MEEAQTVITTDEISKLPPDIAALLDPALAIPASVRFFQKQITFAQIAKSGVIAGVLACLGLLSALFGVAMLRDSNPQTGSSMSFWPFGFALTCLVACWMFISSIKTRWRALMRQRQGDQTRLGIFLLPDAILEANEFGYSLVPRSQCKTLLDETLHYDDKGKEKSFKLPAPLLNNDPVTMKAAVEKWLSVVQPSNT